MLLRRIYPHDRHQPYHAPDIPNIQASWLTVGRETGQLCLHAGANDFGSIMIEENVVSAAGAHNSMDAEGMQHAIREAGFIPQLRDQDLLFIREFQEPILHPVSIHSTYNLVRSFIDVRRIRDRNIPVHKRALSELA